MCKVLSIVPSTQKHTVKFIVTIYDIKLISMNIQWGYVEDYLLFRNGQIEAWIDVWRNVCIKTQEMLLKETYLFNIWRLQAANESLIERKAHLDHNI